MSDQLVPFLVPIRSSASVKGAGGKLTPDIPFTKQKLPGGVTTPAAVLSSYGLYRRSARSTLLPCVGVYFQGRGSSDTHTSLPTGYTQVRPVGYVEEGRKIEALK